MSGKRGASDQITRERFHELDDQDDDGPSQSSRASAEVLAKRKILKPRGRMAKVGSAAPAAPSGFSFGAPSAAASEPKTNAFAGFGSFGKPAEQAASAPTPSFNFGQPAAQNTEPADKEPKANPFGFLKSASPDPNTAQTSLLSVFGKPAESTPSSLVSVKSTEKASKIKALNDTFYTKITQEKQTNPVANLTPILRKYIDYYGQIDNDTLVTDADQAPEPKQIEAEKKQKALPAPSFNFGQSATPSFSFGQNTKPAGQETISIESSREPTPMDQTKDASNDAITIDSDSDNDDDNDSDDSIKVEGPQFTLAKPPTTTDTVFKLSSETTKSTASSGTGPSFTFSAAPSKNFDSPFKLTPSEKKEESVKEKPEDKTDEPSKPSFGSTNNFTWSPGKPIAFEKDSETVKPTSTFTFGASTTPSNETTGSKPAFSFGQPAEQKKDEEKTEKPSFSFGAPATSEKPSFSFGGDKPSFSSSTNTTSTDAPTKPSFNFGAPATTEKPSFNFGGSTTTDSKPTFNFGGSSGSTPSFNFGGTSAAPLGGSSTFNFNFGGSKPAESKTESTGDDEKVAEEEVDVNFKPVVELKDKIEEKTGEEDEELLYTKRAKLMMFQPDNKETPYASKGLGELKVLKHKETGKSRILVRADGSNRPILNTAVSKQLTYSAAGKGHVKVPVVNGEGKLETYLIKVKTEDDAKNLLESLVNAQG